MKPIRIEIITDSAGEVLQALLEKNMGEIISGHRIKSLDDGSKIELHKQYLIGESFGLPDAIPFVLTFASGVGASLLAGWIYDKLKNSDERAKIVIRGLTIPIDDLELLLAELTRVAAIVLPSKKGESKTSNEK